MSMLSGQSMAKMAVSAVTKQLNKIQGKDEEEDDDENFDEAEFKYSLTGVHY